MATNGQAYGIDKFIHHDEDAHFSQDEWAKAFSKAWNHYLRLGREKHLLGFYSWCDEPYDGAAEEAQ